MLRVLKVQRGWCFGCGKSEKNSGLSGELAVMKGVWIRQGFLESLSVLVPVWLPTS